MSSASDLKIAFAMLRWDVGQRWGKEATSLPIYIRTPSNYVLQLRISLLFTFCFTQLLVSLLCGAAAMLFKEHGATVFVVCLAYDFLVISREKFTQ